MINLSFTYLVESSVCLLLFTAAYKVLIANLTHFSWMRFYLLASVILSLILPVVTIPIQWQSHLPALASFSNAFSLQVNTPEATLAAKSELQQTPAGINVLRVLLYGFFIAYGLGLAYKVFGFVRNLRSIHKLIRQNPKEKEGNYWIVRFTNEMPAFSFFNYIFINDTYKNLTSTDLQVIKSHETVHVKQNHTLDVLFFELVSIVFWFNPVVNYLRKSIREVHEYIVDKEIAGQGEQKKAYAQLLLNLACEAKTFNLAACFTGEHIKRRILMVAKPKTLPAYKLLFIVLVPLTVLILLSFSFINNSGSEVKTSKPVNTRLSSGIRINTITWVGNAVFNTDTLNKLLGLKKGDSFSFDELSKCLTEGAVSTQYFDNGYVFYKADFATNLRGNKEFDITITVYEGIRGKIGSMSVVGNTSVPAEEILKNAKVKTGDLFTRTKIVQTVHAIGNMGKFVPEKTDVHVNPQGTLTDDGYAIINLEFVVVEKK